MQQASFVGTVETLIYIIAFYYVAKFVVRLIFPLLVKKVVENAEENLRANQQRQYQNRQQQPKAPEPPREQKKVGEYVDFEEID